MNRTWISRLAVGCLLGGVASAATHVVVKGDTLWDITGHYLGNPFQWPTVWKRNAQIKDAHWIYPGDTVNVSDGGPGAPASAPSNPGASQASDTATGTPSAVVSSDPLSGFAPGPALQAKQSPLDTTPASLDLIVPPETNYISDVLMVMSPELVPSSGSKRSTPQGKVEFDADLGHQEVLIGAQLQVGLGSDQGVKVGDRLLIVEKGEEVATVTVPELPGTLEQSRAIAVVLEVKPKTCLIRTEKVFGRISRGAVVRPWQAPRLSLVNRFHSASDSKPDRVLANTRLGRNQMPGSYVVIDRGEAGNVQLGDIFEFMDGTQDRGITAMRGYGMVVRTNGSFSTIVLVGTNPKPILPGDKAWRIRVADHG
jgi:hypothetical protein